MALLTGVMVIKTAPHARSLELLGFQVSALSRRSLRRLYISLTQEGGGGEAHGDELFSHEASTELNIIVRLDQGEGPLCTFLSAPNRASSHSKTPSVWYPSQLSLLLWGFCGHLEVEDASY